MGPGLSGLVMYRPAMGDGRRTEEKDQLFVRSSLVKLRGHKMRVRAVEREAPRRAPKCGFKLTCWGVVPPCSAAE